MTFEKSLRIGKGDKLKIIISGQSAQIYFSDLNNTKRVDFDGEKMTNHNIVAYCDEAFLVGSAYLYRIRNKLIIKE